jgi:hypothetical protein
MTFGPLASYPLAALPEAGLAALPGSIALSGQATTLRPAIAAVAGVVALSGQAAALRVSLTVAAGAFTLTGPPVASTTRVALVADNYVLAGKAAPLTTMLGTSGGAGPIVVTGVDAGRGFEIDPGGIGGAVVPHRPGDEYRAGPAFTRARYRELLAAAEAEQVAAEREQERVARRARELKAAADAAAKAAVRARWLKEDALAAAAADERALEGALSTLAGAQDVNALMHEAANMTARNAQAAHDDEDEAIALLLLS